MELDAPQLRLLGCLIEKQLATPQHYPLTVNALVAACNQSTNRDPVTAYDEGEVRAALDGLREHQLTRTEYATGSRTPKYRQVLDQHLELSVAQLAVLGVLLLRGPQTVGELRTRTDRLHPFADLDEVERTLAALADHHYGPLVVRLERQAGQKEQRWAHLLGGEPDVRAAPSAPAAPAATAAADVDALRAEVADLRARVLLLEQRLGDD